MNQEQIRSGLTTEIIGRQIFIRETTASTNQDAKAACDAPDGSVFLAEVQTAGRGRLGRSWESPAGCGIWMSILLKPELAPEELSKITLIAGVAMCRVLQKRGINAGIKWPNDIIIEGKKVCGILAELCIDSQGRYCAVVGIGVNVNTKVFPQELSDKATSLFLLTGTEQDRVALLQEILVSFEFYYRQFLEQPFEWIRAEYEKDCITLNREVSVVMPEGAYPARAVGISEEGELIVEKDGKTIVVRSGEVSVRGMLGYV